MDYAGLKKYLSRSFSRPLLIWGGPGTGKTESVHRIGEELGLPVTSLIASTLEPSDIGGIPFRTENGVEFEPLKFFKDLSLSASSKEAVLFLDEINTTHPTMQAPLLRLIQENKAGQYVLPPSVRIIAAGNPPDTTTSGWELTPPMANRFLHTAWVPSLSCWCPGKYASIRSYLIKRPGRFAPELPKDWSSDHYAFPSPRSWALCGEIYDNFGFDFDLMAGAIGNGDVQEFKRYIEALDLLDPGSIVGNPRLLEGLPEDSAFANLISAMEFSLGKGVNEAYTFILKLGGFRRDWGRFVLSEVYSRGKVTTDIGMIGLINDCYGDWNTSIKEELKKKGK